MDNWDSSEEGGAMPPSEARAAGLRPQSATPSSQSSIAIAVRAKQIARRLPADQQKMLRWNCAGFVLLRPGWTRWRLKRKGLIRPFLRSYLRRAAWQPTRLGLEVRKLLERGDG